MSQKIHPTSVRLRGQRTFDSSWYEDSYHYFKEFRKDQMIRYTINSLFRVLSLNITNLFLGRIFIQKSHKHIIVTLIFYKEKPRRQKRISFGFQKKSYSENQIKKVKNNNVSKYLIPIQENRLSAGNDKELNLLFSNIIFKKKQETRFQFLQSLMLYKAPNIKKWNQSQIYSLSSKMIYLASLSNVESKQTLVYQWQKHLNSQKNFFDANQAAAKSHKYILKTQKTHPFFIYLENALSSLLNQSVLVYPLVSRDMSRSAFFLAQKLADLFEKNQKKKRMPYKLIKKLLSSLSKKCLGIRVLCSGRLGGVEMAKKFSVKKGQTSLNVFSQRIDFAQHQALTKYGILGIKVWISY
uniref:Small ribosomal subunit protein uS3m n=1 Tax=Tetraselmis sp. CCMP 881 TaxID=1812852 RepID=A0A650AR79_9CHLO|nr:ribosomal protein S3 [Tetraselmis sp. CCMP 881]